MGVAGPVRKTTLTDRQSEAPPLKYPEPFMKYYAYFIFMLLLCIIVFMLNMYYFANK